MDERPFWPDRHGFELNIGGNQYGAPGSYFAPFSGTKRPMWNMPPSNNGDYLDDRLIDVALQTMEQWREGPFFFYIPFYLVHTPLEAKPKLLEKYRQLVRTEARHTIPEYAAMVEALDTNIGRLLDGLDRLGIADDTLVILTSDNGGLDMHESGRPTNNAPLRNGKGTAYEGGVRVPAFVRLHDVTPAGAECAEPIITMDYFPTILSLCEIETPIVQRDEFDGQDISTVLRDPTSKLPERSLYWHYPHYHSAGGTPYSAIRKGDYRLIEFLETDHVELYNLANDISEQTDLARQDPTRAASMREELHAWRKNVGAQLPTPVANK